MVSHLPRDISISSEQALLIQERLSSIKASKVLEIGSFHGFSACKIAEILPEDGYVISIEKDPENFKIASDNAKNYSNIKFICGDALNVLPTLEEQGFDAIFIDANKARYYDYLIMSYPLLKQGGVIIADNVLFRGFVVSGIYPKRYKNIVKGLKCFIEAIYDKAKFDTYILEMGDGMSFSYKL